MLNFLYFALLRVLLIPSLVSRLLVDLSLPYFVSGSVFTITFLDKFYLRASSHPPEPGFIQEGLQFLLLIDLDPCAIYR